MERPEETAQFWATFDKDDLMARCAALHEQRRSAIEGTGAVEVFIVRRTLGQLFLSGNGVEVGAGSRPFPIPEGATCYYGDIRDRAELVKYFGTEEVTVSGVIDAQTMEGVAPDSLDFVISAHVVEHLFDPLRAIKESIRRIKPVGGIFMLVVPEMTKTFDRDRTPTPLSHVLADEQDGGEGTRLEAYVEYYRYAYPHITGETIPASKIKPRARREMKSGTDIHVHVWEEEGCFEMISHAVAGMNCSIVARLSAVNENLYVIRRD